MRTADGDHREMIIPAPTRSSRCSLSIYLSVCLPTYPPTYPPIPPSIYVSIDLSIYLSICLSLSLSLSLSRLVERWAKTSATTCTGICSAAFAASLWTPKLELRNPLHRNCPALKHDAPMPKLYSRRGRQFPQALRATYLPIYLSTYLLIIIYPESIHLSRHVSTIHHHRYARRLCAVLIVPA